VGDLILEKLEKHDIPEKLRQMHRYGVKNKLFEEMFKGDKRGEEIKKRHYLHYLYDLGVGKKEFDGGREAGSIPVLMGDTLRAIDVRKSIIYGEKLFKEFRLF
jgi:hypothetical protein